MFARLHAPPLVFLSSCLEWIQKNKTWIGTSRIKQIGKHFARIDKKIKKSLIPKPLMDYILELLKDGDLTESLEKINDENISGDYKDILSKLEDRNVTVAPVIQKYPLIQLYFRGIFGVNARADIYLYLLMEGKGNSNRIAREIYYDQKIVYRILKKWALAGFIREETAKKETLYYLQSKRDLAGNIKPRGNYVNWCKVLSFFSKVLVYLETVPWADDIYLLSSLFRDLVEDAKGIGGYFDILPPEPGLYNGEGFFAPFASALLGILEKIKEPG